MRIKGSLAVTALAAAALLPAVPARASEAHVTRLAPTARPAYALQPPTSAVLRPKGRVLPVYASPHGKVLVKLHSIEAGLPLVLAQEGKAAKGGWIPVALPVRPNNLVGWVKQVNVTRAADPWRIDVYRARHKLVLWRGSQVFGVFDVAVGKPSTPTPLGTFYVTTVMPSFGDYGPILMGTSGFSEVYTTFGAGGGDALIAIHGTDVDSSVGKSASHGCIRMHNADALLVGHAVPAGTLVRVLA